MSKPYFLKWIPVEGEIKIGDRAYDKIIAPKDGLVYEGLTFWRNDLGDQVDLPDWKARFNFKKCKLFLCSRDIKVGDELTNLKTGEKGILDEEAFARFENDIKNIRTLVKVIGEPSPDATWVKEGMEFDEDEIAVLRTHDTEFTPYSSDLKQHQIGYVAIKGPCGHFH